MHRKFMCGRRKCRVDFKSDLVHNLVNRLRLGWDVVRGAPPRWLRWRMDIGYGPNECGLWTKTKEGMKLPAPVVRQNEQGCLLARQMVQPLSVDMVGNTGTVASLRISKFLNGGVNDWGEKNRLYVDEDMPEVQSCKSTSKVAIGVPRNDPRKLLWSQLPTLDDIEELGVGYLLLSPL